MGDRSGGGAQERHLADTLCELSGPSLYTGEDGGNSPTGLIAGLVVTFVLLGAAAATITVIVQRRKLTTAADDEAGPPTVDGARPDDGAQPPRGGSGDRRAAPHIHNAMFDRQALDAEYAEGGAPAPR